MEPFMALSGTMAPLMMQNVDTDVIIPIHRLTHFGAKELEPYAFESIRYLEDGADDPDFLLNNAPWKGAPILLAGKNFGCGSSREGAVWALDCIGIRCIIAPSFGGIFFNNCFQNGVLPVILPQETVDAFAGIVRTQPGAPFNVDLDRKVVVPPNGQPVPFEIDEMRRQALLQGLDDLGVTLKREAEIAVFQARDREDRPWIYDV